MCATIRHIHQRAHVINDDRDMLSVSVISALRISGVPQRIVEYWLVGDAKSTGSEDFTNGSQNCFKPVGREANHAVVATPARRVAATQPRTANP